MLCSIRNAFSRFSVATWVGLALASFLAVGSASARSDETEPPSLVAEIQRMDERIRDLESRGTEARQILQHQIDALDVRARRSGDAALQTKVERLRLLLDRSDDVAKVVMKSAESWPVFLDAVVAKGVGGPANDVCASAAPIVVDTPVLGTTTGATVDGEAACGSSIFTPDVWFRFDAPATDRYRVHIPGASYDTVVSVHTACPGTLDDELACNDDFDGLLSAFSFDAQLGQSYWIRVSGFHQTTGDFTVEIDRASVITGTVTNELGEPQADCWMRAFQTSPSGGSSSSGDAFTADDGTYEIPGLEPGTYVLSTRSCGEYLRTAWDGVPAIDDPSTWTPIEVVDKEVVFGIDLVLLEGGSMAGQVTDAAALPLADILIRADPVDGPNYLDYIAFTDATGEYHFEGLYAGGYQLWTVRSGYQDEVFDNRPCPDGFGSCDVDAGDLVTVVEREVTPNVDFALDRLGVVTGQIQTPFGPWLDGATVLIYDSTGQKIDTGGSDQVSGVYEIGGLHTGTYFAKVIGEGLVAELWEDVPCTSDSCDPTTSHPIEVTVGQTTSGVNFLLDELGSVRGVVAEASTGGEVPYFAIRLYAGDGTSVESDFVVGTTSYHLENIPAGTYSAQVRADFNGFMNEAYDGIHCLGFPCDMPSTPVEVVLNAETTGIDFALEQGGTLSGTVTDSISGEPLYADVEIYDSAGTFRRSESMTEPGAFQIEGVPTGSYFLRAVHDDYRAEAYDDVACPEETCDVTAGTAVSVTIGTTTSGIDFALDPLGSISGQVTRSADGTAIAGVTVEIYDDGGDAVGSYPTDENGFYAAEQLSVGTYYAHTTESDEATFIHQLHAGMSCDGGCDPTTGSPISVVSDSSTQVDFALVRFGEIAATFEFVATPAKVFGGFRVEIYDAAGQLVGETYSSKDFRLPGLAAGTYFAIARGSEFFDPQLYEDHPCNGCDPTTGTPILVALDAVTPITMTLERNRSIEGTIRDAVTGQGLFGASLRLTREATESIAFRTSEESGHYLFGGLEPGTYFLQVEALGYLDELYADIPCPDGPGFPGCSVFKGTPIEVPADSSLSGVDFELEPFAEDHPVILGRVTDVEGDPIEGVDLDLWSTLKELVATTTSDANGEYRFDLVTPLDVYVSTYNDFGLTEQIYDGYQCRNGSVRHDLCWYRNGEILRLRDVDSFRPGVDFELDFLFTDGFETGDTSSWSSSVGGI